MRFVIATLGCKVNIYESEAVVFDLKSKGWVIDEIDPQVVIINTCTVTNMSDSKSRKLIRQYKRMYPNAIMVVMGCYAQLNAQSLLDMGCVDVVIGTNNRKKIYDYVIRYWLFKKPINKVADSKEYKKFEDLCLTELNIHTRGFVKVQDGCENFCSYCAIPYSRGPIKSRPMESILKDILELVYTNDVKEIVLAGINTGTYGKDLGDITLAELIETIMVSVPDLYRLRLSSIELMEITDELLSVLKKYENRIANHLHIPLQSGCDETLIRMNRKYLMNEYFSKIEKIRSMFKDIAITADCLAGFVGETEEEFETTYKNIEKLEYADLHIFPYSRRPNTLADSMPNHLNPIVIKERAHKLQELAKRSKLKYYQKFINTNMEVLIEQKKNGYWYGHTSNYLEVKIPDRDIDLTNKIVNVKLVKIVNNCILGEEVA
ncbi:MAG: tRNA (N(6)-L-threonylcarbamoyladenosine(37)-C(2))-methylthiotransferase MtaB [Bacilli bacterium]|nr:tRNA (N(6)-L-threonylcarbamoyladenosine(37)-C(2))-methylthiotransferase MtaB [Bacilli bacterium]